MKNTSIYIGGSSIKEEEIQLLGELLIASYNSHHYEQMMKKIDKSTPLGKHSAYLKKYEALKHEAEQNRILSCLYESMSDRQAAVEFLNKVFDLLN